MNFEEALIQLHLGCYVKLPEWTGYWFVEDKIIKVLTKDGEILSTPWTDKYKDRTDFEITDGSLGFDWAIRAIENFKAVTRTDNIDEFVVRQVPSSIPLNIIPNMQSLPTSAKDILLKNQTPINYKHQLLFINTRTGHSDSWAPSMDDLFAKDWKLFKT